MRKNSIREKKKKKRKKEFLLPLDFVKLKLHAINPQSD